MASTPEVIELLEAYLETAKTHSFGSVAISMVGYPNIAACDYAGDIALELAQRDALCLLHGKLQSSIDDWSLPAHDETLDQSHVVYNVRNGPLGFDFLIWLVEAEMIRVRAGAPAPLKVAFWLGKSGKLTPDRQHWLNALFRPALRFIGAVEDERAMRGHHKPLYVPRDIVAAVRAGESVPRFHTSTPSPYPGAVTITLREAAHDTSRNSNLEAWLAVAHVLEREGDDVVFVRDTARAHESLSGFTTCPQASIDLDARLALYQAAKANLFVTNGPVGLVMFGNSPWLEWCDPKHSECFAIPWRDAHGISMGEQFPWSLPTQRIIWQPDTYANIVAAWNDLRPTLS